MSNSMINIKIYFFASIREKLGKKEISYQLEKDSSVSQLLHLLKIKFNLVSVNDCMVAVDMEYVEKDYIIKNEDKIFLIPPVSGGSDENSNYGDKIIIQENEIEEDQLIEDLFSKEDGAVVVFHGVTRNNHDNKKVISLEYESLVPMAKNEINKIFISIHKKWDISKIGLFHRLGKLYPGETSMIVAISSKHRKPAIQSIDYLIDELKRTVPIWKKEIYEDRQEWV